MGSAEEVRLCIRALIGVIRSASQGSSPVDEAQLAHLRKVVRLLSLSEEQIAAMRPEEREQVCTIRRNAVQKMRLANNVHKSERQGGMMPSQASTSPQSDSSSSSEMPPPPPRTRPPSTLYPMAPPELPPRQTSHSLPNSCSFGASSPASANLMMPPPPIPHQPGMPSQ